MQKLLRHILQNLLNTQHVLKATVAYMVFFKSALFRMLLVPLVVTVFVIAMLLVSYKFIEEQEALHAAQLDSE